MVSLKALLISGAALICGSNVALAAVAASASMSAASSSPSGLAIKEQAVINELAFDGFGDLLGDVIFPIAFDKNCKTLTFISENLEHILSRYIGQGLQCSNDLRQIINTNVSCSNPDGTTSLISQVIFPLAFQALQDLANKIRAQTQCLDALLTGSGIVIV
jgi:hypothetical protein